MIPVSQGGDENLRRQCLQTPWHSAGTSRGALGEQELASSRSSPSSSSPRPWLQRYFLHFLPLGAAEAKGQIEDTIYVGVDENMYLSIYLSSYLLSVILFPPRDQYLKATGDRKRSSRPSSAAVGLVGSWPSLPTSASSPLAPSLITFQLRRPWISSLNEPHSLPLQGLWTCFLYWEALVPRSSPGWRQPSS